MANTTLRNVGIVLVLAVAVYALPGGGTGAAMVEALLGIGFAVAVWLFLMRMYREHRTTIYALGDRYRGVLYASALGLLFVAASARRWFDSAPLTFLWFALLGACIYGLVAVWRHHREYA